MSSWAGFWLSRSTQCGREVGAGIHLSSTPQIRCLKAACVLPEEGAVFLIGNKSSIYLPATGLWGCMSPEEDVFP